MSMDRWKDLASRLPEPGGLSPEEERELGLALRESPEARRLILSYLRLEGALLQQARAGLLSGAPAARPHGTWTRSDAERSSSFRPWISALAAAGLLLALLLWAEHRTETREKLVVAYSPPDPAAAPAPVRPTEDPKPTTAKPSAEMDPPLLPRPDLLPPDRHREQVPSQTQEPLPAPQQSTPREEDGRRQDSVLTEIVLERAEGEVTVIGAGGRKAGQSGDVVKAGLGIETGSGKSLAVLSLPDGTRIEARPETLLRELRSKSAKSGISLYLQRGAVWADVRPQSNDHPLVIQTPRGEARVLGTVFTLRMDPDPKGSLRLDVQEGKVRFTRSADGRAVEVGAGQSMSSGQSPDFVPLRSQEEVISFQDGLFPAPDYAGTRDTQLAEKNPQGTFGGIRNLQAEVEEPREKKRACWPLLRWDISSIPPGSRVHSVSVSLHITEPSHGPPFYFYEPARSWTESEASWKFASSGVLWRFPGSLGAVERWPVPLGSLTPLRKGDYTAVLGDAGVAVVQSWVNAPATNLGLQIAGFTAGGAFHFSSREAAPAESHPRLTIVYSPKK